MCELTLTIALMVVKRGFPPMLEFEQDLGAEWFLDLWEVVPTPNKAMRTLRRASPGS
jgi:hypothetical protein